jgi:glutathione synthase/RimK-type ligase-like ATP-grasp enzyme
MKTIDFTLLTDARYRYPKPGNEYISNIFEEDRLLTEALISLGFSVHRTHWDDPEMDWSITRFAVFRTTWDYFERFVEFQKWMERAEKQTCFVNPSSTILWNLDKHYLAELNQKGIAIPPTIFIEPGGRRSLSEIACQTGWKECIVKPAVSGAARHTYRFYPDQTDHLEAIFSNLIQEESMLLQPYLAFITEKGEVSLILFGGKYSHAVLKKAKPGDFRVQDDFGGTLHPFEPTVEMILLAEKAVYNINPTPVYARVDVIWDQMEAVCVSELELIEPELWMRRFPESAIVFAKYLAELAIK